MNKRDQTKDSRWALLLEKYGYVIEHRSGIRLPHVNVLNRNPTDANICNIEKEIIRGTHERGYAGIKRTEQIII